MIKREIRVVFVIELIPLNFTSRLFSIIHTRLEERFYGICALKF